MAGPRYPLETLRKLRDERAEAQTHALAAQIERTRAAELALRDREAVRREQAHRTAAVERTERERLTCGSNGVDLQRLVDFSAVARLQAEGLARAEEEARLLVKEERAKEQKLREELSAREAEAELVRRHESAFHQRHAEHREKAEEESALEQWTARRH